MNIGSILLFLSLIMCFKHDQPHGRKFETIQIGVEHGGTVVFRGLNLSIGHKGQNKPKQDQNGPE